MSFVVVDAKGLDMNAYTKPLAFGWNFELEDRNVGVCSVAVYSPSVLIGR